MRDGPPPTYRPPSPWPPGPDAVAGPLTPAGGRGGAQRCVLIGTGSLLVPCAEALLARRHEIAAVVSRNAAIRSWATERAIPLLDDPAALCAADAIGPIDYLFSITNLIVLPDAVLALPAKAAINFHDGPLPAYAGLNTPVWALLNGERRHGITWHLMTGGIDRGAIVAQRDIAIDPDETALTLNARCFAAGLESFEEIAAGLAAGPPRATPQPPGERHYYGRRARPPAAGTIDWAEPAATIERQIRALSFGNHANPLATTKAVFAGRPVILRSARIEATGGEMPPGAIVAVAADRLVIATGTTHLAVTALAALDGTPLTPGEAAARYGLTAGTRCDLPDERLRQRIGGADAALAAHEDYWIDRLAGAEPLDLPGIDRTATPTATAAPRYDRLDAPLPPPIATAHTVIAAALACFARLVDKEEIAVGFAGPAQRAAFAGTEPWFAPQLPLRLRLHFDRSFAALENAVAGELGLMERHIGFPADLPARTPQLHATGHGAPTVPPVAILLVDALDEARALPGSEITLAITAEGGSCRWIYDAARIAPDRVAALHDHLATLLAAAIARPAAPVATLPLLDGATRARIISDWNATTAPWRQDACIHDLVAEQAARTPLATAIICEDHALTYRELEERAERLARHLVARGVGPDVLVGLFVDRSIDLAVAWLAVHKAGGAYVPLDPGYPVDRIAYMMADARLALILTQSHLRDRLPYGEAEILCLDEEWPAVEPEADGVSPRRALPHHLAYVIYTSGSTGLPKGVMVEHRNAVNFFAGMDAKISAPGVWLAVTSLSFDISVLELCWTLTRGFTVVIQTGDLAAAASLPPAAARPIDFSLFYFSSEEGQAGAAQYRLLLEGAKFADRHGFSAVWTPERHFHAFGGLYPNPAVTGAAVAAITERVQIRAGSVVLPLHHPARVAEEWSVVDNLSNGRAGISFAAGWQPDDFALRPESLANAKQIMLREIETVRRLWRGEAVSFPGPLGKPVELRTLPRPVQAELPFWLTAAGSPETFEAAGSLGGYVLTHLLGQMVPELAEKIALYRRAWRAAGHPGEGHVSLMLHSFVGPDAAAVRAAVHRPMLAYLRSSANLIKQHAWSFPAFRRRADMAAGGDLDLQNLAEDEFAALLEHAFERYYETSGLFGTPKQCAAMIDRVRGAGVDEVACLIDFGVDTQQVLDHLPWLDEVRAAACQAPAATVDNSLAGLMRRHGVTHLQCTPSTARMLLAGGAVAGELPRLRQLLIGGEAFPPDLARELRGLVGGEILNMYGPTETTVWSAMEPVGAAGEPISLGRPLANQEIFILDRRGQPLPPGVPGEIVIGGRGVVRGYLNRPALDAERFVDHPVRRGERVYRTGDLGAFRADGRIEFLGRLDHQVKIRGHRIELGEIEAALLAREGVAEAVVIAREDVPGDVQLAAYFVPAAGAKPRIADLRDALGERLPGFMVPSHFVALAALPQTPNGKIDRKALPAPGQTRTPAADEAFIAPAAGFEERIAAVWRDVLKLETVGVHDNFFDLGGHSLLAVQAHRALRATVADRLSITDLFRFPTIRALSAHLEQRDGGDAAGDAARHRALDRLAARGRRVRTGPREAITGGA